jgi:hypothetical protein
MSTDYSTKVIWQGQGHSDQHTTKNSIDLYDPTSFGGDGFLLNGKKAHTSTSLEELKQAFNHGVGNKFINIVNGVIQKGNYTYDISNLGLTCQMLSDPLPCPDTYQAVKVFFKISYNNTNQSIVTTGYFIPGKKLK